MNASNTKSIADVALASLIKHTNEVVGSKAELTRRMSAALGYSVARQVVDGWVHPDPAKRVEPKLGLGLILLREAAKMTKTKAIIDLGRTIAKARKK